MVLRGIRLIVAQLIVPLDDRAPLLASAAWMWPSPFGQQWAAASGCSDGSGRFLRPQYDSDGR